MERVSFNSMMFGTLCSVACKVDLACVNAGEGARQECIVFRRTAISLLPTSGIFMGLLNYADTLFLYYFF